MRFLFLILFLFFSSPVLSQDSTSDLQNKINEYSQKITELSNAKNTLSQQVRLLDSKIAISNLKITQAEISVNALKSQIITLTVEIGKLDVYLNQLSNVYLNQVVANYKYQKKSAYLPLLLDSYRQGFNSAIRNYKYHQLLQEGNREVLLKLETTRINYDLERDKKKTKQNELIALEVKLETEKKTLSLEKINKSNLLEITKNDESRYQQLKKAAEDELSSLLKAKFVGKRDVKSGDPIGIMGNTGYSFGDHLHFGVYDLNEDKLSSWTYQSDTDTRSYINQTRWPMNGTIEITQERGHTKYSYLYADRFHHGVDMVSQNKTVVSVNDGVAYFYRNTQSSLGNHVKIFHPDGKMTLYLHLQ
ncbi:MAG: peptidoglycan DD-metalloendopeptidase family protein [Candidatus Shapirobacteria bacterium]